MARIRPLGILVTIAVLVLTAWTVGRRQGCAQSAAPPHAADDEHVEADAGSGSGTISLSAEARANIGLAVVPAEVRTLERTLLLNATLQVDPDREAFVSSRVQGKVTAVSANVGDTVMRGQPLVALQSLQIAETPPVVEIIAPIHGVVLDRAVTVGETVDPVKSLMHIADLGTILARAEVFEADLAQVRIGQAARLRAAPFPTRVFTGRVVRLGSAIDPVRRTLQVWIEVTNTRDLALKPDMFAQVNLIEATNTHAVAVPNEAVQSDGADRFVFVQNGEAFLRQSVVVGERDDRFTAITAGVIPGDLIVTRGAAELKTVALQPTATGVQDESKPHTHP